MMKKNNKTCICCQKKNTFCLNCSDFDNLPRWMAIYHDENCKKICNATSQYKFNNITKEQAREILNGCDLSHKKSFNKTIQKDLDEIYAVDSEDMSVKEIKTTDIIKEVEIVENEKVEVVKTKEETLKEETVLESEVVAEEKPAKTRKRKNYKNTKIEIVENVDNE